MEHEKLICYQSLLGVSQELGQMMKRWPRGYSYLADQGRRALCSAILNLAEGNGKRSSSSERKRFFAISLGSIAETAAFLDCARLLDLLSASQSSHLKSELRHIYYQIRKLP